MNSFQPRSRGQPSVRFSCCSPSLERVKIVDSANRWFNGVTGKLRRCTACRLYEAWSKPIAYNQFQEWAVGRRVCGKWKVNFLAHELCDNKWFPQANYQADAFRVEKVSHSPSVFGHHVFLILGGFQVEPHTSLLVGVWSITKDFENNIWRFPQLGVAKCVI